MAKGVKTAGGIEFARWLTLRWLTILGYLSGPKLITAVLVSRRGRQESEPVRWQREEMADTAGFEGGRRGHEPRHVGDLWKLEKAKGVWSLPQSLQRGTQPQLLTP